jgi:hypothetical protein
MRKFKNSETAKNEKFIDSNLQSFPEETYNTKCKPKGKSGRFVDQFNSAVSKFEKTLRANKAEIAKRYVPTTLAEQIEYSEKMVAAEETKKEKAKLAKKQLAETPRFAGWLGATDIFKTKEHYYTLPPVTETENE